MIKSEDEYKDTLHQFNEVIKIATAPNVHMALNKEVKAEIFGVAMELSEWEVDHGLVTLPNEEEFRQGMHELLEGHSVNRIPLTEERMIKMAELEDGHEVGVGGLLVDMGIYRRPVGDEKESIETRLIRSMEQAVEIDQAYELFKAGWDACALNTTMDGELLSFPESAWAEYLRMVNVRGENRLIKRRGTD